MTHMMRKFKAVTFDHEELKVDVENLSPVDPDAERKLLRKCDLHVLPVVSILYLFAFIDRINIGNARIQGLEADLGMKGNAYNVALFVFFVPYILFEVPSNVLMKKIAPSVWLSAIMFLWGIVTTLMGTITNFPSLVVCRSFLGLFEAGFVPGCVYLISMYYKRHELQWRISIFFCASILAGAFGGLLAYGLASMAGVRGYNGWRWIFIIEGLITIVISILALFFVPNWPETSKFLNPEERELLLRRLREDSGEAKMDHWNFKTAIQIFADWKIWVGTVMYFGVVNTGYSTSFFTPTILNQLGWTAVHAQVMSIPIYVAAAIISLIVAFCTDRLKHRYTFTMLGVFVGTIGYVLLLAQSTLSNSVKYFAVYLITIGGYITQPVVIVWLANNMSGHYKRLSSAALQIGLGNCGGIVASNIYIQGQAPYYPVGYGVSLAMLWLCGLAATIFVYGLWFENRKRDRGDRDDRLRMPREQLDNLGDDHPHFRFTY